MNQRFAQDNDKRMRIQRTTSRTGYETCLFTNYRSTPVSLRLRRQKHDDALHSKYHIASKPVPRFRGTRLAHELIRPKLGTCRVRFIERQRSLFAAVMPVFSWASGLFGMGAGQYSSSPWGTSAKSDISDKNLLQRHQERAQRSKQAFSGCWRSWTRRRS